MVTPSTISFPYPAKVTAPDGSVVTPARIGIAAQPGGLLFRTFIRDGGQVVLRDELQLIAYEQVPHPLRPGKPQFRVTVAPEDDEGDPEVWLVEQGPGCGCGNPLKRFNPDRWQPPPTPAPEA